jgi:arylformamidase
VIHDITPPIREGMPVWPGDTVPEREVLLDMHRGDHITLSTLRATVHLGAHADAPAHYGREGRTIDDQPLERYLGACQVIDLSEVEAAWIGVDDVREEIRAMRLLLRLRCEDGSGGFPERFPGLAPALIDSLADRGVRLVGVNTPSVDPFSSQTLESHARCLARDVAILEGLALADVAPGMYGLIALPLRLVGFDASPVRAVLCGIEPSQAGSA